MFLEPVQNRLVGAVGALAVTGGGVLLGAAESYEGEVAKQVFSRTFEMGVVGTMFLLLIVVIGALLKFIFNLNTKMTAAVEANTQATRELSMKVSEMGSARGILDILADDPVIRERLRQTSGETMEPRGGRRNLT